MGTESRFHLKVIARNEALAPFALAVQVVVVLFD